MFVLIGSPSLPWYVCVRFWICACVISITNRFYHTGVEFEYLQYVGRLILCSSVHLFHPPLFFCQFFFCWVLRLDSVNSADVVLFCFVVVAAGIRDVISLYVNGDCRCSRNDLHCLLPWCFADDLVGILLMFALADMDLNMCDVILCLGVIVDFMAVNVLILVLHFSY